MPPVEDAPSSSSMLLVYRPYEVVYITIPMGEYMYAAGAL